VMTVDAALQCLSRFMAMATTASLSIRKSADGRKSHVNSLEMV
jgi:hypothetical protein